LFSAGCIGLFLLLALYLEMKLSELSWPVKLSIGHPYLAVPILCVVLGIVFGRVATLLWFYVPVTAPEPVVEHTVVQVSISKLPSTRPELFGREAEIAVLNEAWANPQTNVLIIIGIGGQGKSTLVGHWLRQIMAPANYVGASRVYAWSFYSQGTQEDKQASSDAFIDAALRWLGAAMVEGESPWEKGRRVADLFRKERSILVLDGLEPLQNTPEHEGKLRDPGIQGLVGELAAHNPGLCVITTRYGVEDLNGFAEPQCMIVNLEHLSREAGARLLVDLGATDDDERELRQASEDFGNHALALTLLGNYIASVLGGDIRRRDLIGSLLNEPTDGGHARRVMAAYEKWFTDNHRPELSILRMMGLFDRPAAGDAIQALREPAISGVTSELKKLQGSDWLFAVANLRKAGLLLPSDPQEPEILDCHPLVREYFGDKLKKSKHKAWVEGHSRLFDYYCGLPKNDCPDAFEERMPLYAAIPHGVAANRSKEALFEVYRHRLQRMDDSFGMKRLGAFGLDLAAVSAFFDEPWTKVSPAFDTETEAYLLHLAAFDLRALGRMEEASHPFQASMELHLAANKWGRAARGAVNLCELYLAGGRVVKALGYANRSVELADRDGDGFLRMCARTNVADAFHQAGDYTTATSLFSEAEALQTEAAPKLCFLYSLQGYRYCDLLLTQEKVSEVIERSRKLMEWRNPLDSLLDTALEHLSLGRAIGLYSRTAGDLHLDESNYHMNEAVESLRRAGAQEFVALGLLARADLLQAQSDFVKARADLEEAECICARCGLGLYKADCHLSYARLHLAHGEVEQAHERVEKARVMISQMGYHRRDRELADLDEALAKA